MGVVFTKERPKETTSQEMTNLQLAVAALATQVATGYKANTAEKTGSETEKEKTTGGNA